MDDAVSLCGLDGLIISHPYSNTGFTGIKENGQYKLLDIAHNKNDENLFCKHIFQLIDTASDVWKIYMLINKPYLLLWFKLINEHLDEKDFAKLFAEIWVRSENPNCDVNVSLEECIEYFKKANKKYLMDKNEYKIFVELPETIHVYRGVSKNRNPKGLSYTIDKEKAIWFQNRFADEEDEGFLIEKDVSKENILAFFANRGEMEIVVDVLGDKYND